MPVPQSRGRRLLRVALYLGCFAAVAFIVRPLLSVEPAQHSTDTFACKSRVASEVPMPSPGTWDVLDARRLPGRPDTTCPQLEACPLLPPGVTATAIRRDVYGRECGFLTGSEEVAAFTRHWAESGWTVTDTTPPARGTRTLTLSKGTDSGFAWVFPSPQPGRASLLVALATKPRTEDRP